jgi:outer membrane receptor protein involved in Fe transport
MLLALGAFAFVPAPAPALAETSSSSASIPLSEVVITATRLPRPLRDVPDTVIVLPREELDRSPAAELDGVLRSVPSAATFRRTSSLVSDPSAQGLNLLGLGPSGVSRSLLLLDGLPVNDPFGGWIYWRSLPKLGIERIEVAPGGSSALYGSYALGVVVQMFSRPIQTTRI